MAGERRRGIWVPVPGPMSRTIPEAVRRRGGISAEEFLLFGGLNSSVSASSVVGAEVGGCAGVPGEFQYVFRIYI